MDFESNGTDCGSYGDFDRLIDDDITVGVIARPPPPAQEAVEHPATESMECAFCKNNGRCPAEYSNHRLKDKKGNCSCPILRQYRCPTCRATGDKAHTLKYCPKKRVYTVEDTVRMNKRRQGRISST